MKNVISVFMITFVVLTACIAFLYARRSAETAEPLPSPTPGLHSFICQPEDLQATLTLSPAAGNVFGTFTLKNISAQACQIQSDKFINADYDMKLYPNIVIQQKGQPQNGTINLLPDQTLSSQLHYPNGPQCSSGTAQAKVSFDYELAAEQKIVFTSQKGKEQIIPVCRTVSEVTTVEIETLTLQK
jgi:hypothetical protein